jgi:molybdate transport system substrate-binding protein
VCYKQRVTGLAHRRALCAAALLALLPLTACGGGNGDTTLTVLAASSLTGTFTELGQKFEDQHPGVTVRFAFDSSATLAQQATQGAPADVLATADTTTMDSAKSAQASTPKVFATNVMVLATPASDPGHVSSFADLDKPSVRFVMCVPTAPCGKVGQALLDQDHITGKPVSQEVDVKSVLARLTEGEADAGIVYTTDAVAAGDQVRALPIPGSAKQVTSYPIVTLTQSKHPTLAQQFVSLVTGSIGQATLRKAGFGRP